VSTYVFCPPTHAWGYSQFVLYNHIFPFHVQSGDQLWAASLFHSAEQLDIAPLLMHSGKNIALRT
jgi:hypothetical protein